MDAADAYDRFEYRGHARLFAHPRRMEMQAHWRGLRSPPADRCRVLQLGCGDAVHLLWVAASLPGVSCVGLDRSEGALARGRALMAGAGLDRVELRRVDLAEPVEDLGLFDYIVVHGVYSWVPSTVRRRILELCARHLAAEGVLMLSFNAKPGFLLREVLAGPMRHHTRDERDPVRRVAAARRFAEALLGRDDLSPPIAAILRGEVERLRKTPDHVVFHDDLAEGVTGFSVAEVLSDAFLHGFRHLGEAVAADARPPDVSETALRWMEATEPAPAHREVLRDLLSGRAIHRLLLCRSEVALVERPDAGSVTGMSARGCLRRVSDRGEAMFEVEGGGRISVADPVHAAAAGILDEAWPECVPFGELATEAFRRTGSTQSGSSLESLGGFLTEGESAGILELEWTRTTLLEPRGALPRAFGLARAQAALGGELTALHGRSVSIQDGLVRRLVECLDGRRDLAALEEVLSGEVACGRLEMPLASGDPLDVRLRIRAGLPDTIERLRRAGIVESRGRA